MAAVIFHVIAWPTLGVAVLVFGFAPGAALRLIVLFYPRGNLRRQELLGELYAVPRIDRPFWVAEQLEAALFEGLRSRITARAAKRASQPPKRGIIRALFPWMTGSSTGKQAAEFEKRRRKEAKLAASQLNRPTAPMPRLDDIDLDESWLVSRDPTKSWRGRGWRGSPPITRNH